MLTNLHAMVSKGYLAIWGKTW